MIFRRRVLALALSAVLGFGGACASEKPRPSTAGAVETTTTQAAPTGNLTVLAAASLSESFKELGTAFEGLHPGAKVTFSFDASSALATQANNGAPADMFASADQTNMKKVTDAGNASGPRTFARNRLAILVQKGNPKGIAQLADFTRSDVIYVLCALTVPCGNYGKQALDKAGVTRAPASYEANVKGVVTKVTTGQADAGIVYVTDAKAAAANANDVDIPDNLNVIASYPVAVLKQASHPDVAWALVDYLLSPQGQAILAKYGFLPLA